MPYIKQQLALVSQNNGPGKARMDRGRNLYYLKIGVSLIDLVEDLRCRRVGFNVLCTRQMHCRVIARAKLPDQFDVNHFVIGMFFNCSNYQFQSFIDTRAKLPPIC